MEHFWKTREEFFSYHNFLSLFCWKMKFNPTIFGVKLLIKVLWNQNIGKVRDFYHIFLSKLWKGQGKSFKNLEKYLPLSVSGAIWVLLESDSDAAAEVKESLLFLLPLKESSSSSKSNFWKFYIQHFYHINEVYF